MKVVWLLNHYAQDPSGHGGTRHYSLAKYAAECGIRVILIASSVEHLTGRQRLEEVERRRFEDLDGVSFLWIRTPSYEGNGAGRMRNMLAYTYHVLRAATTRELPSPDLVIGSSVHPFAAVAAQQLARRFKVPFVFEVRDLWPETLIQMGRLERSSLLARVLRVMETWLYKRASKVIVLLPRARDYIEQLGIDGDKVVWIPNGVDLEAFPYQAPSDHERLTVMYIGSHGQANALDRVLDAVALVNTMSTGQQLYFRFVGDGPLKPRLEQQARELGIAARVSFEPPVPKRAVPEVAAEADIFIVNIRDLPLYRYGISLNKLFDYLAAGRPIVFASSAVNNPVADAQAGISVPGDDVPGMAEAMVSIAGQSRQERLLMGRRGRDYVEKHYGFRQLGKKLCDELLPLMH